MEEKTTLQKWREIYYFLTEIQKLEPWTQYREKDPFVFLPRDREQPVFFTIVGESAGQSGIALYEDMEAYIRGQARMRRRSRKGEPPFVLQDALICLWGDEDEVSGQNRSLMEQIRVVCEGSGSWLHCERYREGLWPQFIDDDETVELLRDCLGNFWMMLRAVSEAGVEPGFENGNMLMRRYDAEGQQYLTFAVADDIPRKPYYPEIIVYENEQTRAVKALPENGKTLELDWSYLPNTLMDGEIEVLPRMLLIAEAEDGADTESVLLSMASFHPADLLDILSVRFQRDGRPAKLVFGDRQLEAFLSGFCKTVGVESAYSGELPRLQMARKRYFEEQLHITAKPASEAE